MPTERVVKRRPKDRKAQIARASADAFSELGYHAVSMDVIAGRVGITAAALYRHSSSKYELFRDAVLALGRQLVDATAFVDSAPEDAEPAPLLDDIVAALVDTVIANRTAGGLYRWEGRYLRAEDQAQLMDQMKIVNRRIHRPLVRLRPGLSSRERWTLSAAALSVIGSIVDHRTALAVRDMRVVLAELAIATLFAELPTFTETRPVQSAPQDPAVDGDRYETLLRESMLLFHKQGYRETSMEDIAAAVGMPASGIYRHFDSKAELLAASFRRAADQVSADVANIVVAERDPRRAMQRLIAAYVERSFNDPELAYVYFTERVNLPPDDEVILRGIQRATVESWSEVLISARPELSVERARFAVHAAFALVVDLGRLVQFADDTQSRAYVRRMTEAALGIPAG